MPFSDLDDLNELFEDEDFLVLPVDEEDPVGHVLSVTPAENERWDREDYDPKAELPEEEDEAGEEEEGGLSGSAKALLILLIVLLLLVAAVALAFIKVTLSGGDIKDLMFWVRETPAITETAEPTPTPTLDAVDTFVPEETVLPETEAPEETKAAEETEEPADELPLSKVIPQGFASGLTTVNYHGVEQKDAPVTVDGSIVKALHELVKAAHEAGHTELILHNFNEAEDDAPAEVAEHATGLCIDFVTTTNGRVREFENATPEISAWLKEHAHEYGFILRFPAEKEQVTGVSYQPWHYTYVGVTVATDMVENNWCLEEYLAR